MKKEYKLILSKTSPFVMFLIILSLIHFSIISIEGSYFGLFLLGTLVFPAFNKKNKHIIVRFLFYTIAAFLFIAFSKQLSNIYPNHYALLTSFIFLLGIISSYILKKLQKHIT